MALALVVATVTAVGVGRAGTVSPSGSFAVTIHVSTRSVYLHQGMPTVTGAVGDTGHKSIDVLVEASSDGRRWQQVGGSSFLASHGKVVAQPVVDRNTLFRVHVLDGNDGTTLGYSRTVPVYVLPVIGVSATRKPSAVIEVNYRAEVHPVRHAPHRRLYIYVRHAGARLFHLVGSRWLHFTAQTIPEYMLVYDFRDSGAGAVLVCTRVPLLADMGKPFTSHTCGRPTRSG